MFNYLYNLLIKFFCRNEEETAPYTGFVNVIYT